VNECKPLELGLMKIAESFIGDQFVRGLSGGEKRRVSIATELLTSPVGWCRLTLSYPR